MASSSTSARGSRGAFRVYASGPYAGTAGANQISDQNVGTSFYDDNATVLGNSLSSVNVSIEVATDTSSPSVDNVSSNTANVNVSGALLGDISSFQSGDSATATAAYFVYGNTFVNSSGPTSTSLGSGIAVYGASANLSGNSLTAFPTGISVVVGPAGDVNATDNSVTAPAPAIPGTGIYLFAGNATVQGNSVSGFSWMNGPGWWPNSQTPGLFVQCLQTCAISQNTIDTSGIGIAVLSYSYGPFPAPGWPYVAPPSQGPITISDNSVTNSGAFGIGVELTQQTSEETTTPSVSVTGNAVDNSLSGAVGLMVDQGTYLITGNTFTGTTLTGSSGSSQPTGQGAIATASIQVLDAYDSVTQAFVGGNDYVGTTLYTALLNVTTPPQYYATIFGEPALTAPAAPIATPTSLDVDQALTVSGTIPSSGVPPYAWTWLQSVNGGSATPTSLCSINSGSGASGGSPVTCAIPGDSLVAGDTYAFELQVTDSATAAMTQTSPDSSTVSVASALTSPAAPTISATALDVDQTLTVSVTPTTRDLDLRLAIAGAGGRRRVLRRDPVRGQWRIGRAPVRPSPAP